MRAPHPNKLYKNFESQNKLIIFVIISEVDNKEIKNVEFLTSFSIHPSYGESFDKTTGH